MARRTLKLTGVDSATEVQGRQDPVPAGTYKAVVYDATEKTTRPEKGSNPYLSLILRITEEGDYYGRTVFDNFVGLYTTEKAPWLAKKAEQLGIIAGISEHSDEKDREIVLPDAQDVKGLDVEVYLTVKPDNYANEKYEEEHGKAPEAPFTRNEVPSYQPAGGWPEAGGKGAAKKGKSKITL